MIEFSDRTVEVYGISDGNAVKRSIRLCPYNGTNPRLKGWIELYPIIGRGWFRGGMYVPEGELAAAVLHCISRSASDLKKAS